MNSEELQRIIDKISAQGKTNFLDATTENKIETFEIERDIKLPTKYKEWLLFSDGGEIFLPAGIQIYGIEHHPMIDTENEDRPDDSYIVIGAMASGDSIVFEKAEEKIFIYNLESDRTEENETYEDFYAFLNAMYEEQT